MLLGLPFRNRSNRHSIGPTGRAGNRGVKAMATQFKDAETALAAIDLSDAGIYVTDSWRPIFARMR